MQLRLAESRGRSGARPIIIYNLPQLSPRRKSTIFNRYAVLRNIRTVKLLKKIYIKT